MAFRGSYQGTLNGIFPAIREAWREGTRGHVHNGRPMIALDVDEPLWQLSRVGCAHRDGDNGFCPHRYRCEAAGLGFCVPGIVEVSSGRPVRLATEISLQ